MNINFQLMDKFKKNYKLIPNENIIHLASLSDLSIKYPSIQLENKPFNFTLYKPSMKSCKFFYKDNYAYILVAVEVSDPFQARSILTKQNDKNNLLEDSVVTAPNFQLPALIITRLSYQSSHERANCGLIKKMLNLDYLDILQKLKE